MRCTTPAKPAGVYDVRVETIDTTSTIYSKFTYRSPPTISSISPNSGVQAGGTAITITGTNFDASTVVKISGGTCIYSSNTSTTYTCLTPANPAGSVVVSVTNSDSQSTSLANGYTYTQTPILEFVVGTESPNPPNPDNYGSTNTNVTHVFTLKNIGEGSSSSIIVSITGTNPGAWIKGTDNCNGATLAPNATCTVQVTFLGGFLSPGSYSAVLNATAPSGGTTTNALQGTIP